MKYLRRISIRGDLGLQLLTLYLLFVGPVVLAALTFDRIASQRLETDVKASDLALARAKYAYDLEAEEVLAKANSAGSVKVFATKLIDAKANSGGSIRYRGNPAKEYTSSNSGGSVRKSG